MTVKELRQKLSNIEDQGANVLVDILNGDDVSPGDPLGFTADAEVLELRDDWGKPTVIIFAASVDLYSFGGDSREP